MDFSGSFNQTYLFDNDVDILKSNLKTADAFIERTTYEIAGEHTVRVVTGDLQEQLVVLGSGGLRVSTSEFWDELCETALLIKEKIEEYMK